MSHPKFVRQLLAELPLLVARGIIPAGSAEALRRHYEAQIKPSRSRYLGLVISAILGGLLVGAGVILLLAHNWDELSRPVRAALSVAPLLAAIALSLFTLLRRSASVAWREGCGTFYFLAIGAAIALVSQTYHLYNDFEGFLRVWLALAVPLVYLLGSGVACAGLLACAVALGFSLNDWRSHDSVESLGWALAALPFFVWRAWRGRESLTVTWLAWAFSISGFLLLAPLCDDEFFSYLAPAMLFTFYYAASCRWFGALRHWRNPLRATGCLGIAVTAMLLTFKEPYRPAPEWAALTPLFCAGWALAATAWCAVVMDLARRRLAFNWVAALFPGIAAISLFVLNDTAGPLLMNAYVLVLGVFTLVRGVKHDRLLSMNEGLLLLAALIVSRFFGDDYGLVARGVAFIAVGAGFLGVNLWVLAERKNKKESTI